jgi:hypothetical protein
MNKHLNLFHFFNSNENEYIEDNLSRGFALCLKYDTVLLDKILNSVLGDSIYKSLFNTDYPDYTVNIDLQKKASRFSGFDYIYAIACSPFEISTETMHQIEARNTDSPITDVSIEINNLCLIFEFKRNMEDCSAQLKSQAEKIKELCSDESEIKYVDLNWKKIIKIILNTLSLQRQINTENQFTSDFAKFIEKRFPEWFPQRILENISFPINEHDPNNYYLNSRLDQIKDQVANVLNVETSETGGRYYRKFISVNWGWANEVHIEANNGKENNYISIKIYLGDTKAQGWNLYKSNKDTIKWPASIQKFELQSLPYFKFSHFNSGLFWYCPNQEGYNKTFNRDFFANIAGRKKKESWGQFEETMNTHFPNWISDCYYKEKIINSNRTYFDLSMGILLTVNIPYLTAQNLDNKEGDSSFSRKLSETIVDLKNIIDN